MKKYLLPFGVACLVVMNVALAAQITCVSFVGGTLTYPCQMMKTNLYVGRGDEWPGAPDFYVNMEDRGTNDSGNMLQGGTPKTYARSLILADNGDAPDFALRRAGDGNDYKVAPSALASGTNIANIYWQAYGGKAGGGNAWWPGNGNNGRNASIFVRTCGSQTSANRAGEMYIATSPTGNPGNPVARFNITCDGKIRMNFGGSWKTLSVSNGFVKAN